MYFAAGLRPGPPAVVDPQLRVSAPDPQLCGGFASASHPAASGPRAPLRARGPTQGRGPHSGPGASSKHVPRPRATPALNRTREQPLFVQLRVVITLLPVPLRVFVCVVQWYLIREGLGTRKGELHQVPGLIRQIRL